MWHYWCIMILIKDLNNFNCWRIVDRYMYKLSINRESDEWFESFVNVFKFDVSCVLPFDLVKDSPVMNMMVVVFSFKMDLIEDIMVAFFVDPDFGYSWFFKFGWDFVLDQMFDFFEVFQNLCVNFNDFVSHFNLLFIILLTNLFQFKCLFIIIFY